MINNNIIFVGGIHGVGKTTLCHYLANELNIMNYSSSKLIAKLNSERVKVDKTVNDINGNQDALLNAINLFLSKDENYILDGHFCLLDENNKISQIPLGTFKNLDLKLIVILTDNPKDIIERISIRDSRGYSAEFITEFQENEIEYAKYISEQLEIDCKIVNPKEKEEITRLIKNII